MEHLRNAPTGSKGAVLGTTNEDRRGHECPNNPHNVIVVLGCMHCESLSTNYPFLPVRFAAGCFLARRRGREGTLTRGLSLD